MFAEYIKIAGIIVGFAGSGFFGYALWDLFRKKY